MFVPTRLERRRTYRPADHAGQPETRTPPHPSRTSPLTGAENSRQGEGVVDHEVGRLDAYTEPFLLTCPLPPIAICAHQVSRADGSGG
jgi:hypothetical protein